MPATTQFDLQNWQEEIENHFLDLLKNSFPGLQAIHKWKQTMWHLNERLIVCLVFGKAQIKFCFFNNPLIKLNKLQRWNQTTYSQNLEINSQQFTEWDLVKDLIEKTINL